MYIGLVLQTFESLLVILFVPYLCLKFWSLRSHFIISSRFPALTITITLSILFLQTYTLIQVYLYLLYPGHDSDIILLLLFHFNQPGYFVFFALIILRTYLVYRQGKISQTRLKERTSVLLASHKIDDALILQNSTKNSRLNFNQKMAIFVSISIGTMALKISLVFRLMNECFICETINVCIWAVLMIIGIFAVILSRKTKEVLSCRKETFIIVMVIIAQITTIYIGRRIGLPFEWRSTIGFTLSSMSCFILFVVPLVLIYRIEGSINHVTIAKKKVQDLIESDLIEHLASEQSFHVFADFLVCVHLTCYYPLLLYIQSVLTVN